MTEEQQAEFNRLRRAYQQTLREHEAAGDEVNAAREAHEVAFKAVQDASAAFHNFCDALAKTGAA